MHQSTNIVPPDTSAVAGTPIHSSCGAFDPNSTPPDIWGHRIFPLGILLYQETLAPIDLYVMVRVLKSQECAVKTITENICLVRKK